MAAQKKKRIQATLGHYAFKARSETPEGIPASGADSTTKAKLALRIGSQNIRKMEIGNTREGCPINSVMKGHEIDLGLFQETNKNWSTELSRSLQRLLFLDGPAKMIAASEPAQREGHLPGGCLTVAKGDHAGRIFKHHSDRLGRFCYAAMHGKDGGGIILMNLYRVTQNKGVKAGTNTSYMRQRDALRMSRDHNPDPKN